MHLQQNSPLVSVIIPCYNHGRYLQQAIDSVHAQEGLSAEIIVVDDGSVDNTREVAGDNPGVVYVYQQNSGLSAARNTGVRNSKGAYLLFLDADDWLLPNALHTSITLMEQHPDVAFVSAGHKKVFMLTGQEETVQMPVTENHYLHLLQGNYIGMHATVLYRKNICEQFLFDETLRACEDYDLYLKIARNHPVLHHTGIVAAYRIHGANMSGNVPMMLRHVLLVLKRQENKLQSEEERASLQRGIRIWKDYYAAQIAKSLQTGTSVHRFRDGYFLLTLSPLLPIQYFSNRTLTMFKTLIKKSLPPSGVRLAQRMGFYPGYKPPPGKISIGDLNRVTPLSQDFGYDRGGPVDRYYIEAFLQREATHIRGRVLEIGDNTYTLQFGRHHVEQSDILHIDEKNTRATFIGDLSNAPHLPDNTFDAIVLTQTLHLIYDFRGALATCHRILKPGGTLLLTVPGLSPIDQGEWKEIWYWAFTDKSMKRLMEEFFPGGNVQVKPFGNVLAASAFLYGMGLPEVDKEKLDHNDPQFQIVVTVRAQKNIQS